PAARPFTTWPTTSPTTSPVRGSGCRVPLGRPPDYVPAARRDPYRPCVAQDFGWNVSVSVRHVVLRCSPSQSAALAVYISAYPTRPSTTNPRSMVRYLVPPSVQVNSQSAAFQPR